MMNQTWRSLFLMTLPLAILGCLASSKTARGQITPDKSLGSESSVVTPNITINGVPSDRIDGGATRGNNLFHSFQDFNISAGRGAYFSNPAGIENIISRVTGGNPSNIFGTLGVLGKANLFFINPNGIIFGSNARLDLNGSFLASTANSLIFNNKFEFSATNPQAPPLLTVNIPIGLRFRQTAGEIRVQGAGAVREDTQQGLLLNPEAGLRVQPDQTLALLGGNVILNGGILTTDGGRLELGSVTGDGLVSLTSMVSNKGFSLGYSGVQNFGNIQLSQQSAAESSGEGGGDIQLTGRQITLSSGSQIGTITKGSKQGGSLTVNATDSVQVIGISTDGKFQSSLRAETAPDTKGTDGDVTINTPELLVQNGGFVSASTYGAGKSGSLTINATDSVQVTSKTGKFGSALLVQPARASATGAAGTFTINTHELLVKDGAFVSAGTYGMGNGGNLNVNADSVQVMGTSADGSASGLSTQAEQNTTGTAGNLTINTRQLMIQDGAFVSASTKSRGNAGNLTINATDSVQVGGSSSLLAQAQPDSSGKAGNLTINTHQLLVQGGAFVSAGTYGIGNGGNLNVNADSVQVIGTSADGSASDLSTQAEQNTIGTAGNLTINTRQLMIQDGAFVSTRTYGAGKGGDLTVNASELLVQNGGFVSASTYSAGKSGNLTINANDSVQVTGLSSKGLSSLLAEAQLDSSGEAGNLTVNTHQLLVQGGAFVSTGTYSMGNGGNLNVNADSVQVMGTSADGHHTSGLSTQAEQNTTGTAGNLTINTRQLMIQDGAFVSASTKSRGNAGKLTVNATDSVQVIGFGSNGGSSLLAQAQPNSSGEAGNLTVNTRHLLVRGGAFVSTGSFGTRNGGNLNVIADSVQVIGTSADGKSASGLSTQTPFGTTGVAGNLTINTHELLLQDGGFVSTGTFGAGKGGDLTVNATDSVQIIGASANGMLKSSLLTEAQPKSSGDAGNLTINTGDLVVRGDGAVPGLDGKIVGVLVRSRGTGNAGDLTVNARSISLDNKGNLTATSASGNGGNITLTLQDLLLLRHNSNISTSAGTAQAGGNGGNITINSPLIVAFPLENSDITANAFKGTGGRVDIKTQGIFGIKPLSGAELERRDPSQLNPSNLHTNDITAISQQSPSLSGTVTINTPEVDTSKGLVQLPENIIDPSQQIAQNPCKQSIASSEFISTGRGGLPPSPNEALSNEGVRSHWIDPTSTVHSLSQKTKPSQASIPNPKSQTLNQIVPAQGWVFNNKGQVVLTAYDPTSTGSQRSRVNSGSCPAR